MPAIPKHSTATEDSAWDGPAAVAAMPAEYADLHYCHAWETQEAADSSHTEGDDDEDDKKSAFKFPHHRKKGGPANIPACRNGLARLAGANIPDADRAGVKAHLQAHLDDAGEKSGDDSGTEDVVNEDITAHGIDRRFTALANLSGDQRVERHLPRVQRLSNRADWFRITDYADGTPARLDVYDEIGFWGVSAAEFNAQLQSIQAPSIEVHVNSPGGDVFDGLAICNLLRAHPKPVDVVVDGLAASAASYIAMAGDTVTMQPNSQMMIHDAAGLCMGNAADMADMGDLLDKMSANIAGIYATKTGQPADQWRDAMKAETWYSADEAVAAGLADRVGELARGAAPAATNKAWNLSFYAYSGRSSAPGPVSSSRQPAPADIPPAETATPAPPEPVVVGATVIPVEAKHIDPDLIRAAFAGAFRPTQKETR